EDAFVCKIGMEKEFFYRDVERPDQHLFARLEDFRKTSLFFLTLLVFRLISRGGRGLFRSRPGRDIPLRGLSTFHAGGSCRLRRNLATAVPADLDVIPDIHPAVRTLFHPMSPCPLT